MWYLRTHWFKTQSGDKICDTSLLEALMETSTLLCLCWGLSLYPQTRECWSCNTFTSHQSWLHTDTARGSGAHRHAPARYKQELCGETKLSKLSGVHNCEQSGKHGLLFVGTFTSTQCSRHFYIKSLFSAPGGITSRHIKTLTQLRAQHFQL